MAQIVNFLTPALGPNIIEEIDVGGDNELDVQEIYSEWKDWLLGDAGARLGLPPAFRYVGADPISGTQNLGSTFFLLNNWRIRPAERNHKLILVGNIYTDPAGYSIFLPTVGAYTVNTETRVSNLTDAVLLNSPDIQFSSFEGQAVLVDVNNTTGLAAAGTGFPAGTRRQPVDNFADALTIGAAYGLNGLHVLGTSISVDTHDFAGFRFVGDSPSASSIVVEASANVEGCEFALMDVQGTFDGTVFVEHCIVQDVSFVAGAIEHSRLRGTIALGGGSQFSLLRCVDDLAGFGVPTIDFGGSGTGVIVRSYRGGMKFTNKTGPEDCSIDGVLRLILDASFGGSGDLLVRGIGPAVDIQGTFENITEQLVSPESVGGGAARLIPSGS